MAVTADKDLVNSLNLHDLLSRLDLSKDTKMRKPVYEDLYPDNWAGDSQAERRHREAVLKIINWPTFNNIEVGL